MPPCFALSNRFRSIVCQQSGERIGNALDGLLTVFVGLICENDSPAAGGWVGPHQRAGSAPVSECIRWQQVAEAAGVIGPVHAPAISPGATFAILFGETAGMASLVADGSLHNAGGKKSVAVGSPSISKYGCEDFAEIGRGGNHSAPRSAERAPVEAVPVPVGVCRLSGREFAGDCGFEEFSSLRQG